MCVSQRTRWSRNGAQKKRARGVRVASGGATIGAKRRQPSSLSLVLLPPLTHVLTACGLRHAGGQRRRRRSGAAVTATRSTGPKHPAAVEGGREKVSASVCPMQRFQWQSPQASAGGSRSRGACLQTRASRQRDRFPKPRFAVAAQRGRCPSCVAVCPPVWRSATPTRRMDAAMRGWPMETKTSRSATPPRPQNSPTREPDTRRAAARARPPAEPAAAAKPVAGSARPCRMAFVANERGE